MGPSWVLITMTYARRNRVFAENLVGLGFLYSVSYIKAVQTHQNLFCCGEKKMAQMPLFNLFCLGLGCGLGLGSWTVS